MSWQKALDKGQELILATSSKSGTPRAIVVISLGFVDGKLLIGSCLMRKSLENIQENKEVSIVSKQNGEYYRLNGCAMIYSSGKYLDVATERSNPPLPKQAIVVDIKEIFDLDKCKEVKK